MTQRGHIVNARCSDDVYRRATIVADEPDTYFSITARVSVKGKTVTGMLTHDTYIDEYLFDAYSYLKNANMLPNKLTKKWGPYCRAQ